MDDEGASLLKNSREQSVTEKLRALLIFGVNDKRYKDIRVENTFKDKSYLKRISTSRQRWIDERIEVITKGIVDFLKAL